MHDLSHDTICVCANDWSEKHATKKSSSDGRKNEPKANTPSLHNVLEIGCSLFASGAQVNGHLQLLEVLFDVFGTALLRAAGSTIDESVSDVT
eukprot:889214-Rhodomonas_salina.4